MKRLNIAIISVLHITEKDWSLLQQHAEDVNGSLHDTETYLDFNYFDHDCDVTVSLGRVYLDREEDAKLDAALYDLTIKSEFSIHFANLVMEARRSGYDYLVFSPHVSSDEHRPTLW